ncbi:fumarylacetoacetate hydrolase family protein [Halomonas sp. PR-M31]|uniref:fumarylacetoacetate hydrolase family protein n=1 Tax=Halomonas sp. PR-M31 TaxID=1471202 RepID=UPI000ABF8F1B|nr:fumarylacetoacetate hydrolase family protein [Halomonas sp. PR-M31]
MNATEWVAPCFEIVDSRIENWKIRIEDTVADNASCGIFVIGENRVSPEGLDLAALEMTVWRNGEAAGSGVGAAVQGHPAEAVAWLANTLGEYGIPFRKGELILSGAWHRWYPSFQAIDSSCGFAAWATAPLRLAKHRRVPSRPI